MAEDMKQWALSYARGGMAVFPVKAWGDTITDFKSPLTQNGFHDATTDKAQIEKWWTRWPTANIGIAMGSMSGGIFAIDLDVKEEKGVDGRETLREWERENGKIPGETWLSITGRGGYHYFYKSGRPVESKIDVYGDESVDIRGEGSYIVAPPSLHYNGRRYEWEQAPDEYQLLEAPGIVFDFISPPQAEVDRKTFELPEQIPEGQRTDYMVKMVCSMQAKGASDTAIIAAVRAENDVKCIPPLSDKELEKQVFPALKRYEKGTSPYMTITQQQEVFAPFIPFAPPDTSKLPVFPADCLPDKIKGYVMEVAESLQVSVDMAAVSALTIISLCVQGKYIVNPKPGWVEPLNLYSVIVARPSERKSPVMREMTEAVYQYMQEENGRREFDIEEYNLKKEILSKKVESIKQAAAKAKNEEVTIDDAMEVQRELSELEEVKPLRLIADDASPEALTSLLYQNGGKMSVISSEGGIFGIAAGRYSEKTNIDIFLKAYSGDPIQVDRKGRSSEYIPHPALTMLLFVQPSVIQEIMGNSEFQGRGFLSRFLYSIPVSRVGSRTYETKAVSEPAKMQFNKLVCSLLDIPDVTENREIRFSQEAHNMSRDFFNEIEHRLVDDLEDIDAWAGKFHGQVMRIAGVLHCIKYEMGAYNAPLEGETMRAAIEIGRYFLEHAKTAFEIMGASEDGATQDAKYILKRLDSTGQTEISKRDLFDLCKGKITNVESMENGLSVLVNRGYIRIEKLKTGGKGRPTEKVFVNPEHVEPK